MKIVIFTYVKITVHCIGNILIVAHSVGAMLYRSHDLSQCEMIKSMGNGNFFRHSRAAKSVVPGWTWLKFELIQALMYVIVTCEYEKDLNKNS